MVERTVAPTVALSNPPSPRQRSFVVARIRRRPGQNSLADKSSTNGAVDQTRRADKSRRNSVEPTTTPKSRLPPPFARPAHDERMSIKSNQPSETRQDQQSCTRGADFPLPLAISQEVTRLMPTTQEENRTSGRGHVFREHQTGK